MKLNVRDSQAALVLLACLAAQPVWAQGAATPAGPSAPAVAAVAPKIAFDSTVYDFGKVMSGEVIEHGFVFTNLGTAPLEILMVRPGCGCTTAGQWDREVQPGKTGSVPLRFNSTGYGGMLIKSATVTCNDPRQTNLVLQLRGTVWRPIEVSPSMAIFNVTSETATNPTKVLRILSNLGEPITLSDVQCSNAHFRAELKTVQPGKEFELEITALPPFGGRPIFAPISVRTSSRVAPSVNVSAYLGVQPVIEVSPLRLVLPAGPLTGDYMASITVRNNGTNVLALSDAKSNPPGVRVSLLEPERGRRFVLALTFPAGFQIQPGRNVEITVASNHPAFPIIRVPVAQYSSRTRPGGWVPRPGGGAPTPRPTIQSRSSP